MKVIEESLSAIKKELAELEEEENKIEKETIDVRHEVEKFENLVKKNQAKVEYWKKEASSASHSVVSLEIRDAGRSSEVERSLSVRWVVGSILHGVDPLCSTTGVTKAVVCAFLWDGADKRTLAANRKE